MRVYHDWEFLETGNSVIPISVGMVREDNEELYFEFSMAPFHTINKHPWLRDNVIPALKGNSYRRGATSIRNAVHDFLDVPDLELWGWYSAYDHVCLGQLFGAMINLPDFVPMYTNDIKQLVHSLGEPRIPDLRKPSETVHNALDDARVEMRMHQWILAQEQDKNIRLNMDLRR